MSDVPLWLDEGLAEYFEVVESKHGRFGLLICEDMWHVDGGYLYFLDGVDAAFENDHHVYKRTLPLKEGKVDHANGVLYIRHGDALMAYDVAAD